MDAIDRIRAFARFYTTRTGLHARSYLGSGLGFSEARLLHDLSDGEPTARDLARRLGLDEGYVSRAVAGFARRGWIERLPEADARRRRLRLTSAGKEVAADLVARSRAAVGEILQPLAPAAREAAAEALDRARGLLAGAGETGLRDLRPGDAGWVLERHGALYAAEELYGRGFEAVVAGILAGFLGRASPRERGWIAARGEGAGEMRLGCLFVMEEEGAPDTCRLRLVLVEPSERGTGIAQRMLEEAMAWARGQGYGRMVLWTHESHRAAGRLYARAGFGLVSSAPARAFGQDVVDQTWARDL